MAKEISSASALELIREGHVKVKYDKLNL